VPWEKHRHEEQIPHITQLFKWHEQLAIFHTCDKYVARSEHSMKPFEEKKDNNFIPFQATFLL
jgi:hypothetical protein